VDELIVEYPPATTSVEARDAGHEDALLAVATVGLDRRGSI